MTDVQGVDCFDWGMPPVIEFVVVFEICRACQDATQERYVEMSCIVFVMFLLDRKLGIQINIPTKVWSETNRSLFLFYQGSLRVVCFEAKTIKL